MNYICPVCNYSKTHSIQNYRAINSLFKNMKIVACDNCVLYFASPAPDQKKLNEFNNRYFTSAHGGVSTERIVEAFFSAIAKIRYYHIYKYIKKNNLHINTILEVGPGLGYLAKYWKKKNPAVEYYAIETDSTCHKKLNNYGVNILDQNYSNNTKEYDLVILSHVLEHVSDPKSFLLDAMKNLKKGGALFIEVPCNDWKHKDCDEPHLLFFNKSSLKYFLNIFDFSDMQLSYHGSTISELCKKNIYYNIWLKIRFKLINLGLVKPFAKLDRDIEAQLEPIERAAIKPHSAHIEHDEPAWWLRAMAIKQ